MLIKLRKNAQITIPSDVVRNFNMKEGDYLDCVYKGDEIVLTIFQNMLKNEEMHHSKIIMNCFKRFYICDDSKVIWIKKKRE